MRKALCVGINDYQYIKNLYGCVNDAREVKKVLERNGDGKRNFNVKLMCASDGKSHISRNMLRDAVEELFHGESEVAVFYYSGHGSFDSLGGYLCTSEVSRPDEGLSLNELMGFVGQSSARNKVVILDSCFSGLVGNPVSMQNYAMLQKGTTLLAACGEKEYATEENGHGTFTSLMVEALYGGAMNLLGEVSPGSVYSYIDRSLGAWDPRPVFKANISEFVSLRSNTPPIDLQDLWKITEIFQTPDQEFLLDPTYESDKHEADTKEINKEHEAVFALLQKYVQLNLVTPVGENYMYYAAIHRKSCKLTVQGRHYWNLVKKEII